MEHDPLLVKNHPDPRGRKVDLVACTATKKAETLGFASAENELERCVFGCKWPVHPCAVAKKTLRRVEITHLEAVDERRASLDMALADADANVPFALIRVCRAEMSGFRQALKSAVPRHVR
jgi:hypothetical protein